MAKSKKEPKSQPVPLDEPFECKLRLDSCDPESLPVPSKDDGTSHEKLLISGRFADTPIDKVCFATKNEDKFEEDKCFAQDGDVKRVQFNKIQVPVKIDPKAKPGIRYFTVAQFETTDDGKKIPCTVTNVDLSFRLT